MTDFLICDKCGDVIGVYEPLVLIVDGQPSETSQAARPDDTDGANERYHRACYESRVLTTH
jgi:hypothetical protein